MTVNQIWKLIGQEGQEETRYIYKCQTCGQTITSNNKDLKILCPNCVRKEAEKT